MLGLILIVRRRTMDILNKLSILDNENKRALLLSAVWLKTVDGIRIKIKISRKHQIRDVRIINNSTL